MRSPFEMKIFFCFYFVKQIYSKNILFFFILFCVQNEAYNNNIDAEKKKTLCAINFKMEINCLEFFPLK